MMNFDYKPLPWNITFAAGAVSTIRQEVENLGFKKALILSTTGQSKNAQKLVGSLGNLAVGHFDQAKMHVPIETVESAIKFARDLDADCTISIGGGSTTGLGKALTLKENIANIAIPTTYAGSEMTNIWGITEDGTKITGRDDKVVPDLVIYDPELTLSLPPEIVGSSGLNALAQAVVNVATDKPNAMVTLMALEAIKAIATNLPKIIADPKNLDARSKVLYGSSMAGAALGTGTTSIHHKLCHTFGGTFNTPHAETHAILLPHSVAYNTEATAAGTQAVADAMGVGNAASGLHDLALKVGAATALKEIGISEQDMDKAIEIIISMDSHNPAPITEKRLRQMLENAYHGRQPIL